MSGIRRRGRGGHQYVYHRVPFISGFDRPWTPDRAWYPEDWDSGRRRYASPDEVLIRPGVSVTVHYVYPLSSETVRRKARRARGWTALDLVKTVMSDYRLIYQHEAETSTIAVVPRAERTGMLNRNRTNGTYGIWGHDLEDLVLAGFSIEHTGPDEVTVWPMIES